MGRLRAVRVVKVGKLGKLLFVAAAFYLVGFSTCSNLDLTQGRPVLFMDERISFDNIHAILHASGLREFFASVFDGGDQRYGRIFYNLTAPFCWIPSLLFGDPGQIVAARLAQTGFLLAAYIFLVTTFIRAWFMRSIALWVLVGLPFTPYFATMPKPEPVELLLFSIFLRAYVQSGFSFGRHWILLGMAFGAKISLITAVPVLVGFSALAVRDQEKSVREVARGAVVSVGGFVFGLAVAVPILFARKFNVWLDWTFRNTGHAADDLANSWVNWIEHIVDTYFGSAWAAGVFAVLALVLIGGTVRVAVLERRKLIPELLLLMLGLFLMVPLILNVKRIWGLYLHPGMCMLTVGFLALAEGTILDARRPVWIRRSAEAVVVLLTTVSLWVTLPAGYGEFRQLAARTQTPAYKQQMERYDRARDRVVAWQTLLKRPVRVAYDPSLFLPNSTPMTSIEVFWGPFQGWTQGYDLVVSTPAALGILPSSEAISSTRVSYADTLQSASSYALHVAERGSCRQAPCYVADVGQSPELQILVRQDLVAGSR